MADQRIIASLAVAIASIMTISCPAEAQSSCTTAIMSLAPCLGYITGNSSTPSSSCCTQLFNVVQTQAQCLCALLNGAGSSFGININQTQALTLPGACKVQTPPVVVDCVQEFEQYQLDHIHCVNCILASYK